MNWMPADLWDCFGLEDVSHGSEGPGKSSAVEARGNRELGSFGQLVKRIPGTTKDARGNLRILGKVQYAYNQERRGMPGIPEESQGAWDLGIAWEWCRNGKAWDQL
ncbi:hypothetical protein C8R44DRAFT_752016 [Mycena epipterygia]|nr:hypothetical protein C8R44DRAFT_752016 [Mycena epipterygia]